MGSPLINSDFDVSFVCWELDWETANIYEYSNLTFSYFDVEKKKRKDLNMLVNSHQY